MDLPKVRFRRAVQDAANLYDIYISENELDQYLDEVEAGVMGDWYNAVVALKQVIVEHDVFPVSSDVFNMNHNLADQPKHPVWAQAASLDDKAFYLIQRPGPKKKAPKTWPGATT